MSVQQLYGYYYIPWPNTYIMQGLIQKIIVGGAKQTELQWIIGGSRCTVCKAVLSSRGSGGIPP